MRSKIILLLVCVILVFGCSKKEDDNTITFWMQMYGTNPTEQEKTLKEIIQKFYDDTGIKVSYSLVDWGQALTKYTLACTGGEAPDVGDMFFIPAMVAMGGDKYGPMMLDDVVADMGGEGTWYPNGKFDGTYDGKWYGIPWRMDVRVLMYNTEHFQDAGITEMPKTWAELIDVAKKLTKTDANGNMTRAGLAWYNNQARFDQTWFCLLSQTGGNIMNKDYTEPTYNSKNGYESLEFMRDVISKYKVTSEATIDPTYDAVAEFMAEKVSMVFGVSSDMRESILKTAPQLDGKFAAAMMPTQDGSSKTSSIISAGLITVLKTSKNPEAAKQWVKFFCNEENQLAMSKATGVLISRRDVMADSYMAEDTWKSVFAKQADYTIPIDVPIVEWAQIDAWPNGPLPMLTTEVMAGVDIQEALDKSIIEFNRITEDE